MRIIESKIESKAPERLCQSRNHTGFYCSDRWSDSESRIFPMKGKSTGRLAAELCRRRLVREAERNG